MDSESGKYHGPKSPVDEDVLRVSNKAKDAAVTTGVRFVPYFILENFSEIGLDTDSNDLVRFQLECYIDLIICKCETN